MKRISIIVAMLVLCGGIFGQSPVDKVFDKYAGQEGYTTVVINSFMFKFLASIESDDPEYESFKNATQGIESIRILTQDGAGSVPFAKEILDKLPRQEYEEMMVVKEVDEEIVFLVKEVDGEITEFLLIVSSEKGGDDVLISITGLIDMESIASITSGLDLPAMENLEELEED
jgi:hypothetical protein